MTTLSGLAMSWQEWHKHDAVALAELVRAGQVAPKELCAQAAPEKPVGQCDIAGPIGIGEEAVVTDAMKSVGQDMDQKRRMNSSASSVISL